MKKILFPILLLGLSGFFFQSCEDEMDLAPDEPQLFSTEGAVASPGAPSPDFFDASAPDAPVSFDLSTIGEEVTSVRILKDLNNSGQIEHAVLTSFPTTVEVSLTDAAAGTGVDVTELTIGDNFVLSFEVTTPSGTYRTGKTVSIPVSCSGKFPGTYEFTSSDYFCGGDPVSGTVTITETDQGKYVFDDFAFGTYQECYGGAASGWGTLAIVRYTDTDACNECSQSDACNTISVEGVDVYGDSWTFNIIEVNGSELTLEWENTYGEFGTTVLTRPDGSNWPPLK
jgi:hypothetical protein